jgi:hypothetical protein
MLKQIRLNCLSARLQIIPKVCETYVEIYATSSSVLWLLRLLSVTVLHTHLWRNAVWRDSPSLFRLAKVSLSSHWKEYCKNQSYRHWLNFHKYLPTPRGNSIDALERYYQNKSQFDEEGLSHIRKSSFNLQYYCRQICSDFSVLRVYWCLHAFCVFWYFKN